MQTMQDGTYSALGDTLRVLTNSRQPPGNLQLLVNALNEARQRNAPPEEIKATITEHVPELASMLGFLPRTRSELYAIISILIAVIGLYIKSPNITKEQTEAMIDKAVTQSQAIRPEGGLNRAQRRARGRAPRRKAPHK